MTEFIYDCWNGVMNHNKNHLKHIPDLQVRHLVLQILAWMWCIVFSMYVGSWFVMGVSMVAHALFLAAVVVTVGTFETARRNPNFFDTFSTSTPSRARAMYYNGKRIPLDKNDVGGEHE